MRAIIAIGFVLWSGMLYSQSVFSSQCSKRFGCSVGVAQYDHIQLPFATFRSEGNFGSRWYGRMNFGFGQVRSDATYQKVFYAGLFEYGLHYYLLESRDYYLSVGGGPAAVVKSYMSNNPDSWAVARHGGVDTKMYFHLGASTTLAYYFNPRWTINLSMSAYMEKRYRFFYLGQAGASYSL